MAAVQELRRGIQRKLHELINTAKTEVLYKLVDAIKDEVEDDLPGDDATEVELYDFIVDFLKSDRLASQEDQGMSRLLVFNDFITDLQRPPVAADEDCELGAETDSVVTPSVVSVKADRTCMVTSQVTDVIKLADVAALLPRREFKLHSGQISDSDSDVSYSSLCRQIDEGLAEKFTEAEIIRTVLKVIKPGTFKDMLMTKPGLTVAELKRFLRAHLRDKSSAELFQELSNAKQQDRESPHQYMYRLMGLKQRVMFASQQSSSEFQYTSQLIQGVFLHSLYQGMSEKYAHVRRDLRPLISNMSCADDFILEIMTKSVSEDVERQTRLGQTQKAKAVTVSAMQQGERQPAAQPPAEVQATVLQTQAEVQAQRAALHELTAQVSVLAKAIEKALTSEGSPSESTQVSSLSTAQPSRSSVKGKCRPCITQGIASCNHCFRCGQEGHRAVGCLSKYKSGNIRGSLGRDHQ